jgi:hypothetical protein
MRKLAHGPLRTSGDQTSRRLPIQVVNDKGRYRQDPETGASEIFKAVSLATEIPSRSFTAS